tara:strand:+ start:94 stop:387 length:294 start_codon:yes stop_codon:yes gene_type:complete
MSLDQLNLNKKRIYNFTKKEIQRYNSHDYEWWIIKKIMGEAKRRRDKGLPPKTTKKVKKDESPNIFQKFRRNQIFPVILAVGFVIFLIVDLVRYYNQ